VKYSEVCKYREVFSMRVAIMSDIHDDVTKLRTALERLGKLGDVGELICLGDLCSPFVVAELDIDGKRFSVNHFDNIGKAIAAGQKFDVVCYGHNHRFANESIGKTAVVNPGEIYGVLTGKSTFAVYDTRTGEVERVDID
jgi:predicted phosphodiesterase